MSASHPELLSSRYWKFQNRDKMATIFSRIVKGEIPSYKVAESDKYYAFLDISPLAAGHTLVVPKSETDYIFDLNDEDYQGFFLFAKSVAVATENNFQKLISNPYYPIGTLLLIFSIVISFIIVKPNQRKTL